MNYRNAILTFALALASPALTSCISMKSDPKLFVFSEPGAAMVLVDGEDTGFTTPAMIEPGSAKVTIVKEGFVPVTRSVRKPIHFRYPRWNDGGTEDFTLAMSIFRTADDFFFPLQFSSRSEPRRLFVRLQPVAPPETK
ncbi:MAG: PEGA domain-containing protein [Planctomycetota bacterium]